MTLLLAGIIVLITHAVEAVTGFGCTVLALPFVTCLLGLREGVMLLAVLAWVLALYFAITKRRAIEVKQYLIILVLAGAGLPIGMRLAGTLPAATLKQALACFIIAAAVIQIVKSMRPSGGGERQSPEPGTTAPAAIAGLAADRPRGTADGSSAGAPAPDAGIAPATRLEPEGAADVDRPPPAFACSALLLPLGGIVHGAFASGGPLVVLYAARALPDKGSFRATLCLLWATLNTVLMIDYARASLLTPAFAARFAAMLPFLAAGILAGEVIHHRVNARVFRGTVFAVLLAVGIVMLVSSFLSND